jgi:hypothetical protein
MYREGGPSIVLVADIHRARTTANGVFHMSQKPLMPSRPKRSASLWEMIGTPDSTLHDNGM